MLLCVAEEADDVWVAEARQHAHLTRRAARARVAAHASIHAAGALQQQALHGEARAKRRRRL
jgi:hypothetical protein